MIRTKGLILAWYAGIDQAYVNIVDPYMTASGSTIFDSKSLYIVWPLHRVVSK